MKKIETKAAKFEAGKTYFANWTACDGSDHVSTFMIEKRSAHSVTINGKRYMIPKIEGRWEYPAVEFIRATAEDGFPVYVEACNVFTTEADPDDYAVSQEALEVATNAEIELANKASKAAKKNYSINPVIGEDDNMKLNHVDIYTKGNKVEISSCFECKNIETAYRRFRKIMIQIDADHPELQLGGENDWLPANKITLVSTGEKYEEHFCGYNENDDMIFSASPVEALAVDINEDWFYFYGKFTIENIKEETQMTNNLPTGIIEVANGKDYYKESVELADKIHRDAQPCDDNDDELIDPPVDSKLTADIAKYQDVFDSFCNVLLYDNTRILVINDEKLIFDNGNNLATIISDRYHAEITFNNGRKRFRYRGMITKRADFLDAMNNEIVAAEQKEIFGEFHDDYQMPDTALDPNADYFQIRIFPKFANGTESSFHATANDFDHALELINQFKTLDLPFIGLINRNTVCGEEYYRHNRDGSEVINPPQPKLPDNIKDSLQRAMKAALEQYRRYNLNHNQKAANRERECFMICKKALKEVA